MKYALHASLHRPARRPDQTASRPGGNAAQGADASASTEPEAQAAMPRPARPALLPPPPTMIRQAGRPSFLSTPPSSVVTTAHDRPTLRFPAVPPPLDSLPGPLPISDEPEALEPIAQPVVDRDRVTEQIAVTEPTPIIDINEPTLEEAPVRAEDFAEENEGRQPARARMVRARKKGSPPQSRHAAPTVAEHHVMPEIDPAAWLADEAHARSSDRGDSADGVDNSDTVVPVPRPAHRL
jgi:hypothetical protein